MLPCHVEYVVRGSAALNETRAFQLHQYFDQQVDQASNALVRFAQLGNQHVVRQIPLEHRSAEPCQLRYLRPTPLALSTKSMPVDQLQRLRMHFLNVRIRQRLCNQ